MPALSVIYNLLLRQARLLLPAWNSEQGTEPLGVLCLKRVVSSQNNRAAVHSLGTPGMEHLGWFSAYLFLR